MEVWIGAVREIENSRPKDFETRTFLHHKVSRKIANRIVQSANTEQAVCDYFTVYIDEDNSTEFRNWCEEQMNYFYKWCYEMKKRGYHIQLSLT